MSCVSNDHQRACTLAIHLTFEDQTTRVILLQWTEGQVMSSCYGISVIVFTGRVVTERSNGYGIYWVQEVSEGLMTCKTSQSSSLPMGVGAHMNLPGIGRESEVGCCRCPASLLRVRLRPWADCSALKRTCGCRCCEPVYYSLKHRTFSLPRALHCIYPAKTSP